MQLALAFHPDKRGGCPRAKEVFNVVQNAYNALKSQGSSKLGVAAAEVRAKQLKRDLDSQSAANGPYVLRDRAGVCFFCSY